MYEYLVDCTIYSILNKCRKKKGQCAVKAHLSDIRELYKLRKCVLILEKGRRKNEKNKQGV